MRLLEIIYYQINIETFSDFLKQVHLHINGPGNSYLVSPGFYISDVTINLSKVTRSYMRELSPYFMLRLSLSLPNFFNHLNECV